MTEKNLISEFKQAKWADYTDNQLRINKGVLPIQMKHSDGTGLPKTYPARASGLGF